MFERFKDCVCHPRYIGKYNKDSILKIFSLLLIFFCIACGMLAGRSYIEKPFDESSARAITSKIISGDAILASYDADTKEITGASGVITGEGFKVYILSEMDKDASDISIVLNQKDAYIYRNHKQISKIDYEKMKVDSFQFEAIKNNDSNSIYHFKMFILTVLNSSNLFFQTVNFIENFISVVISYLICLLFSYFLSLVINPTIDRGVRIRLCLYDSCIFFVGSFFAFLFNADFISYIALALPLVYTLITFRHIVKVVIRR